MQLQAPVSRPSLSISLQTSSSTGRQLESVLTGSPDIHIRSRDDVMRKVAAIAQDGPDKLLVRASENLYVSPGSCSSVVHAVSLRF